MHLPSNWDRKAAEEREAARRALEEKPQKAKERTTEAQNAIKAVRNILQSALKTRHAIDWEKLKKQEPFSKPEPTQPVYLECPREPQPANSAYRPKFPEEPAYRQYPLEPQQNDAKYKPALNLLDRFLKSRMQKKQQAAQASYQADRIYWQRTVDEIQAAWTQSVAATQSENERRYAEKAAEAERWNREAQQYQEKLAKKNAAIDKRRGCYEALQAEGVEDYCEMVLASSEYPDGFPRDFDVEYIPETKILIVEYALPAPEHLPRLKEIKYIKSKDEFLASIMLGLTMIIAVDAAAVVYAAEVGAV